MKIVSWNINGIRTFRSNLRDVFSDLESSIICIQETKASRSTLDEDLAIIPGYNSYFSSPRHLSGYSGVATYCLDSCRPRAAEEGLAGTYIDDRCKSDCIGEWPEFLGFESNELPALESEGRALVTKHDVRLNGDVKSLVIINVYCPRMDPDRPERAKYKLQFYNLLQQRAEALVENGHHVLIAGDINTSHKPIDSCHASEMEEFCSTPSRQWMDSFLNRDPVSGADNKGMFVDTFRHFNPNVTEAYTCWMTVTGARKTNYGTRIDYVFADVGLVPHLDGAAILPDVEGSDHCPIVVTVKGDPVPFAKCPAICTKYWPEFSGKQQSLMSFLRKRDADSEKTKHESSAKVKRVQQKTIRNFFQSGKCNATAVENEGAVVAATKCENAKEKTELQGTWKALLKGPPKPPKCTFHQETCLVRVVKKQGPNYGRQFFVCCRAEGHPNNPDARCDFFQWVTAPKIKMTAQQ